MSTLRRDERGSAAAELTLLTPILILLLLFVVFCGRIADTELRLNDVAHQAARAATLARTPAQATASATTTADDALATAGVSCSSFTVSTDTQALRPGGMVTTTVSCSVDLGDLTMLGIPGSKRFESTATSPIDMWRGSTGAGQ